LLRGLQPELPEGLLRSLFDRRLVARPPGLLDPAALALRYQRNPLEDVSRVIFEFTSRCNFSCGHCYNAAVPRHTETNVAGLRDAAETFMRIGVRRFDFIGGEVSRYGDGWLELVRDITRHELARLVEILNHLQERFVFRLHAERRLREYLDLVDEQLFGRSFVHLCTLRAVVTMIARRVEEDSVDRANRGEVRRVNEQVAALTGHLRRGTD
jgi:hypothetical protein